MNAPLEFGRPWALWLLLLLVPVAYLAWTTRAPLRRLRWWVSTLVRVALVLLVVLSLSDVRLSRRTNEFCVFFLVDGSKSTGRRALETAERRIDDEVRRMAKDDRFGVIVFAQRPVLERTMGPRGAFKLRPLDPAVAGFTNIGRAVRFAVGQFPRNCQKRIVLLSDGNQNLGDAVKEARAAAANDVDIMACPLRAAAEAEVLVDRVIVPARARPHQPIELKASIRSTTAGEAVVKVFRDNEPIAGGTVRLEPGANVIRLASDAIEEPGFHRYEVLVEPAAGADAIQANNAALAYTQVHGSARVLYLEGFPEQARRLTEALRAGAARARGGFALETGSLMDVPQTIEEMSRYDCIILSDVPASTMSGGQMTALKHYVEQLGGGLVMLGGEKSLTTGGYVRTPVEEVLPVSLELKREKHLASLAIVIVVDKSGSMGMSAGGGTKMDLANQACAAAIALLEAYDEAAVLEVDTAPKWVTGGLRSMTGANKALLTRDVLSVRPGGAGIYVKTGIAHAFKELQKSRAQTRHLILFADACDSEQQNGCYALARQNLASHRITLTAVGLGSPGDPHVGFLRTLSERCGGGRFYLTSDAQKLPQIFAKDTYIVSRNALVEIPEGFRATRVSRAEMIDNIDWRQAPNLYGYVATMPDKPGSEILLVAKDDEPLLARWRCGLGKAVVFTSDAKDRWARDWAAWGDFQRFWSQVVRWTMRETRRGNVTTQVAVEGTRARILVDAVDSDGRFINGRSLSAHVVPPGQNVAPQTVPLLQVGPGRYAGEFDLRTTGAAYQVIVEDREQKAIVDSAGAVLSYAPEFRDMEPDTALLYQVAEASGGRYAEQPAGTFLRKSRPVSALASIWVPLLAVAVGLLVVDIASRRLVLPAWLTRRREDARRALARGTDAAIGRLRQSRDLLREKQQQFEALPDEPQRPEPRLTETLLRGPPPERRSGAERTQAAGDDEIVPLRPAGPPGAAAGGGAPTSATERLLRAKRRGRTQRGEEGRSDGAEGSE